MAIELHHLHPGHDDELFATETEAKMYMASLPHFVDGELHILREGENT